jgi:hypothetical protein
LIKHYLVIIQTYKSTGCIERASKFYEKYSRVEADFLLIRELVIANKKPRRVECFSNLVRYNESLVHI